MGDQECPSTSQCRTRFVRGRLHFRGDPAKHEVGKDWQKKRSATRDKMASTRPARGKRKTDWTAKAVSIRRWDASFDRKEGASLEGAILRATPVIGDRQSRDVLARSSFMQKLRGRGPAAMENPLGGCLHRQSRTTGRSLLAKNDDLRLWMMACPSSAFVTVR